MKKPETVDEYIAPFPQETQRLLQLVRGAIRETVPDAEEVISYGMPGYKFNGMLVWFAGYKKHIGFYPKTNAIKVFKKELTGYKTSKGAIQFPLDKPLPVTLIKHIVKLRAKENLEQAKN